MKLDITKNFREVTDEVIVAFSGGKDSLALVHLLAKFKFSMRAYFMYFIDDLEFQQEHLKAVSDRFGLQLRQYPHPDLTIALHHGVYRRGSPEVEILGFKDIEQSARADFGMQWMAGGEKMNDALERRGMISACNGIDHVRGRAYPLATWNDGHVSSFLASEGAMLPADYDMFGHSWGGHLDGFSLSKIRERFPRDFKKIVRVFPFVEGSIIRYEEEIALEQKDQRRRA